MIAISVTLKKKLQKILITYNLRQKMTIKDGKVVVTTMFGLPVSSDKLLLPALLRMSYKRHKQNEKLIIIK